MNEYNSNGWPEYRKMVLKELERLNNNYERIQQQMADIREEIATLKVKAGVWGLAGSAIPLAITAIGYLIKQSLSTP